MKKYTSLGTASENYGAVLFCRQGDSRGIITKKSCRVYNVVQYTLGVIDNGRVEHIPQRNLRHAGEGRSIHQCSRGIIGAPLREAGRNLAHESNDRLTRSYTICMGNSGKVSIMKITTKNILDELAQHGEGKIKHDLSSFSCPVAPKLENFIKHRAIDFSRRKISITYLVSDVSDDQILGYFALTHKALSIPNTRFSNTFRKKLERFAKLDPATGDYNTSAFPIAQLAKNFAVDNGTRITGRQFMSIVNDILVDIQHRIGGGIVYLDCEDIDTLKHFYENEGFYSFGERFSPEEDQQYIQYLRLL